MSTSTSTSYQCRVTIVGAGLGGLAAAIGISLAGHKVTILEQAAELGEVSAERVFHLDAIYLMKLISISVYCRLALVYKYHPTVRGSSGNGVSFPRSKTFPSDHSTPSSAHTETVRSCRASISSQATKNVSVVRTTTYIVPTSIASSSKKLEPSALRSYSANPYGLSTSMHLRLRWRTGVCIRMRM